MAEAMKGTKEAQEAFQSISKMADNPEEVSDWMAKFMPAAMGSGSTSNIQPEAFKEWLEDSWRMMGVVPRSRYLELLERCDTLQRRLEKAEETIQNLRDRFGNKGQQEADTKQAMNMWGSMVLDAMKAQTDWMQSRKETTAQADESEKKPEDTGADK
ncbi:MAG: hypothetical protein GY712_13140 [Oceanicoccus sp.]|uniref:hypothetical protein n=1 Tax=Oceanicoccus sp. TaxID=2691044 RepID=UPI0026212FD2|nr:hypothetical protein [Oceanicoccus sp.]MCP3908948.1 hypothetical protein [Oceanicoccus sp.]